MHVLHVIDSLAVGGAERMLVDIANATAADGHQVSVCITRAGDHMARDLRTGVAVWVLGRQRRLDWSAMRRFACLVAQHGVDVIHAHGRTTFSFVALAKTIGLIRRPILLHDHYGIETDCSVPKWFRFWARREVGWYVAVYSGLRTWARKAGVPADRITVIGNALDLNRIGDARAADVRQEAGVGTAFPAVGVTVAGLRAEKGIDVLIEAVAQSAFRQSMVVLVVGGERDRTYARECQVQRDRLGLGNTVVFIGERSDALSLIKGADFAVLPSRSESGPLVLIECMACGVPFVATKVGGIAHRVAAMGMPEFAAPGDPVALAAALDRLLGLPRAKWAERGVRGREIALCCFDICQTMPEWYEAYANVQDKRA